MRTKLEKKHIANHVKKIRIMLNRIFIVLLLLIEVSIAKSQSASVFHVQGNWRNIEEGLCDKNKFPNSDAFVESAKCNECPSVIFEKHSKGYIAYPNASVDMFTWNTENDTLSIEVVDSLNRIQQTKYLMYYYEAKHMANLMLLSLPMKDSLVVFQHLMRSNLKVKVCEDTSNVPPRAISYPTNKIQKAIKEISKEGYDKTDSLYVLCGHFSMDTIYIHQKQYSYLDKKVYTKLPYVRNKKYQRCFYLIDDSKSDMEEIVIYKFLIEDDEFLHTDNIYFDKLKKITNKKSTGRCYRTGTRMSIK